MIYEIWDIETGNLVGSFGTEAEAFAVVLGLGRGEGGQNAVSHLMLGWSANDGNGGEIATGEELLALAGSRTARIAS